VLPSPNAVNVLPGLVASEDETRRHISMQTVLDKVQQELAMQQARGQLVTRSSEAAGLSALSPRLGGLLPYIVATGIAVVALIVVALVVSSSMPAPIPTPTEANQIVAVAASPTSIPATVTAIMPSPTAIPPSTTPPPSTQTLIPAEILISPTVTLVTPTATLIPPTVTPLPPTATPVPPSDTPTQVEGTPAPTSVPSDWLPVRFIYNSDSFYWMNDAGRSINARPIVFEHIGGAEHFEGQRWAYWTMEAGRCMEIVFADVRFPQRPDGCRPNAYFTPTRTQSVDFWTGSGEFRVLWNGTEIAVCEIAAGECSAAVPPA
jgi:hypothetical protein